MNTLVRALRRTVTQGLNKTMYQSQRSLRTIPMDSQKIVVADEAPILTQEQANECFTKGTMTYSQAIDYIFYLNGNKNIHLKAFLFAAILGFIASTCYIATSNKLEKIDSESVAKAISETKSLNPIKVIGAIFSALDIAVPNVEPYTQVAFPQSCEVSTIRVSELPLSAQRIALNKQREKFNLEPLPPLERENVSVTNTQLLGVGLRAMGKFDYVPYARAYTFGLYASSSVLPTALKAAKENPDILSTPEKFILAHGVADKTLRLVFCQSASGKHIADGFQKSFGARINKGQSTGNVEDGIASGNAALEKLCAMFALVPSFKTGDEVTLTWSPSGTLVVTLPDHTLDSLEFYKDVYSSTEAPLSSRKKLRDTEEWKEIVASIREKRPAYPAPSLQLQTPIRPAALLKSPTLCRAIFEAFVNEEVSVSPTFAKSLKENWSNLVSQFSS